MDVQHGGSASLPMAPRSALGRMLRSVVVVANSLALLLALIIAVRRLTGSADGTPGAAAVLGMSLAVAGVVVAWRFLLGDLYRAASRWLYVSSAVLVLLAAALALTGSSTGAVIASWSILLLAAGAMFLGPTAHGIRRWNWWDSTVRRYSASGSALEGTEPEDRAQQRRIHSGPSDAAVEEPTSTSGRPPSRGALAAFQTEAADLNVSQQVTRARQSDGRELVFGVLVADFVAGQRSQTLHVAFCPPLEATPQLAFQQMDGPTTTIRAALVQTYGMRLELRLARTASAACRVSLDFRAEAPASEQGKAREQNAS